MNTRKLRTINNYLRVNTVHPTIGDTLDDMKRTLRDLVDAILEDEKTSDTMIPVFLFDQMSRIDEVRNYARFHDITVTAAIERLVNSGLSHEHRGWTS